MRTLPWTAAPMVIAPIAGMLARHTGLRAQLVLGLVLQAAALVWLAVVTEDAASYGVGMGFTFAPSATAVLEGLPEDDFAIASSANLANGGEFTPSGYAGAIGPALLTGAGAVAVVAALFAPGCVRR